MRKLTLLLDDDVYDGLQRVAGRGNIGKFVSEKVKPFLVPKKPEVPSARGMLAHLARPISPEEEREAARLYFEKRYAAKGVAPAQLKKAVKTEQST